MVTWPLTREELIAEHARLAALEPATWQFEPEAQIGGTFVCFRRGQSGPGQAGDPAWAAACLGRTTTVVLGHAGAPYEPGLLALREGALLEAAVRALPELPDALLVDATGRDHPTPSGPRAPARRGARTRDRRSHAPSARRRGRLAGR